MATVMTDEEKLVRARLAEISLPKGVRLVRIDDTTDWLGEPALKIYFAVSRKVPLNARRLTELDNLSSAVSEAIRPLNLGKFPYVKWKEAA